MIEQKSQKIIIIVGAVLFFIIVFLVILLSVFSKKPQEAAPETVNKNLPTPTGYRRYANNPFRPRNALTPTIYRNNDGTTSTTFDKAFFPIEVSIPEDREFLLSLYDKIHNNARFRNKDFELYYSEKFKKFVYLKKTDNADKALAALLKELGISLEDFVKILGRNPLSMSAIDLTTRKYSGNFTKQEFELLKEAYKNNPNLFKEAGINLVYDSATDTFFLEVNSPQDIERFNDFVANSPYKSVLKDSNYVKLVNTPTLDTERSDLVKTNLLRLFFSNSDGKNNSAFSKLFENQSRKDVPLPTRDPKDSTKLEETTTGRVLKTLLSFEFSTPQEPKNESVFEYVTPPPKQGDGENEGNYPDSNIPTDSDLSALDTTAWGLPPPKAEDTGGARGYTRLLAQIKGNSNANWATKALLDGEKLAKSKGYNVIRYLNTAWIWFENGSSSYPDPYQINCNDERPGFVSATSAFCSVRNFQIAGYQAADRQRDYTVAFKKFYNESDLRSVMQKVVDNSSKASQSRWRYSGMSIPNSISLANIAPSSNFFDPDTQKYTLIVGKDPNIVAALNSFAVSQSDVVRALKGSGCGYGYICATEKQILSNMAAALYIFENGSLSAPGSGGGGGGGTSDNTRSVLTQAERILPRLQPGVWNFYNKHTQVVSGNGYTTPYRAGLTAGEGSTTRNGIFWCTNLVISAYRLAGISGPSEGAMESVIYMRGWWQRQQNGFVHVAGNNLSALQRVKPGCAFFLENNGQHTGLVKSVNMDSRGNGTMVIYESNSGRTESSFPIVGGVVKNTYGMQLTGFGCRQ